MDNSVKRLTMMLEPLIFDLEDQKRYLEEKKEELENVSRLVAYTKDNVDMVSVYADQDLITDNLEKIHCDKNDYKACCYLLQSEDESVKRLPQYEEAHNLVIDIVEYFKLYKAELMVETQEIKTRCEEKEIEKKYYNILKNKYPYIEDISEFKNLLDTHDITDEDKINILMYVIKNNLRKYKESK